MADRQAKKLQAAFTLQAQGDLAGAEKLYRQVLAVEPDQPEAMRLLGEVLINRGQSEEAIRLLQRLTSRQSANAAAQYSLGNAYRSNQQIDQAIAAYRRSVALDPAFAGSHHGLGLAFRQAEREREALEHFRQAARLQPSWALAWKDLGMTFAVLGELALSEAALNRAVGLEPSLADARRHLAAFQQTPAEPELAAISSRAHDLRTPLDERIELYFALGRMLAKASRHDDAFNQFAEANRLLRGKLSGTKRGFDQERLHRDVDRIISVFTPDAFDNFSGWGNATEQPVFMVGMPRAGSTLFEQIAASHPAVFGAGERYGIGAIAQRIGWSPSPAWTEQAVNRAAAEYLATLPQTAATRVIDKMPDNIFQLGLIAALFPNARVIFCERDPRDLAVSCFFQHFSEPHGYDTDLEDIAFRIQELARLKNHWLNVLPLRSLTISYEELLAAPEVEAQKMIAFLGLPWDEKCLAFHKTERVVRTASWAQVRQPLYLTSVGQWRLYKANLGKLLTALDGQSEA